MANVTTFYAETGDGKSNMQISFVDQLIAKYPDAKVRLVAVDNIDVYQAYIDAGIIEYWPVALWEYPFETLDYATRGFWPEDPMDPTSKIRPPTADTWKTVKLMICEGMSNFADLYMQRLGDIGGEGISIGPGTRANTKMAKANAKYGSGEEASDLINFMDGEYGVGGNSRSHYNIVQKAVRKNVLNTAVLPCRAHWTTLTCRATEQGKAIYGPLVVGNAATPKVQQWCSSLIHLYADTKGSNSKYYMYFKDHVIQETGSLVWKSIQRVPLKVMDPKFKTKVQDQWDGIIPDKWEWTNDSQIAEQFLELQRKMREAVTKLFTN